MGVPIPISSTHGSRTAPSTVTSIDPGSAGVPTAPNQDAPYRAISARWASVSTFCTSVGRPPSPCSESRGGARGRGDAALDPVHDRAGLAGDKPVGGRDDPDPHRVGSGRPPARPPHHRRSRGPSDARRPSAWLAPDHPRRRAPPRPAPGAVTGPAGPCPWRSQARLRCRWPRPRAARPAATAASLRAVGNAAPPRPQSPDRPISSISAARPRRAGRPAGAGRTGQRGRPGWPGRPRSRPAAAGAAGRGGALASSPRTVARGRLASTAVSFARWPGPGPWACPGRDRDRDRGRCRGRDRVRGGSRPAAGRRRRRTDCAAWPRRPSPRRPRIPTRSARPTRSAGQCPAVSECANATGQAR